MKKGIFTKALAMLLVVLMFAGTLPLSAFAKGYDDSKGGSDYYNLISERNWDIAPGVKEYEQVLNNDAGTRRQVMHAAVVDLNNPYVKVIPGYKGMIPSAGNYGTQSTSTQALEAEKLGYGNVVVATNAMLSWYTEAYYKEHPELVGEPLYYNILDGYYYENSRGSSSFVKNYAVLVINYDNHPLTGEPRPADIPKVAMRSQTDPLTGWEQNAICVWAFLVKPDENGNPVSQYPTEDHGSGVASRTFIGIRADGTLVMAVSDGEQAPYSTGFTMNEMADYMIKMGCIYAANCDGGGSTTFCSQRPGEDLKVNCSLADGGERPTTNTILVVSTAPADGQFARAAISTDYDYYTPGSSVTFNALGTDAVGTKVDVPADVQWQIKEAGMGTIENGVFTSNGTEGTVTAQMVYEGKVVGEKVITIITPDTLLFEQPVVTIPFGKTVRIPVKATATIKGVAQEIGLSAKDVTFTITNEALGVFDGLDFIAVSEENASADVTGTLTATLNMGVKPTATVTLSLGKASEVLWDFEDGQIDIDEWNVINSRTNDYRDYYLKLSLADRTNGQVHDGDYALRLEINGLASKKSDSGEYAWIRLGVDGAAVELENARRVGFWLYVPEDNIQCWVQGHYMTDSNGDGVYDTLATVSMMESENVYYNIDESGWHYMSMDISAFEKVALKYSNQFNKQDSNGQTTGQLAEKGEFFLAIITHRTKNNKLWSNNGTINGPYTYYLDSFTVDYSDAVDDRENPVFDKIYLNNTTALVKRDVITTTSNILNLSAAVADATTLKDAMGVAQPLSNVSGLNAATAKVYIDGVEVACTFADGKITANGNKVADGYHRVKFEICDNAGNKSVIIRVVKVESGSADSTLALIPADSTLDRIPFGSIYWMNLVANKIETIQSVETVIDLNSVNHWQLDHMELAEGFTAEYTINDETNTATITITRTGTNYDTGAAVLAKLPVRILYFDTDIKVPGYTAATYWTSYNFFAQDMKMDVDKGLITFTNGTTGTFSNEEFHVNTEMFTTNQEMSMQDPEYLASHGTTHVHTPVALPDKEPTCTENGYTGRTFCAGCNSPVEWGATIPATGHTYEVDVENRKLVCDCGRVYTGTGLHVIGGNGYYTTAGTLTSGWLTVDEAWYYFDAKTFASVPTYFNGYVTYEFEADGKLVSGVWHKTSAGIRYYEGPSYLRGGKNAMTWYTIDGKEYCMEKSGYVATGTRWVNDYARQDIFTWYTFDEDGVCLGKWNHTGLAEWNGTLYYVKDGVSQYGMYLIDGDYYYFYFTNYYAGIRNERFYCKYNNGLLPQGYYRFDRDGKLLNNTVYCVDGTLYYFVKGNESKGNGKVEINGIDWTVEDNGKVLFTGFHSDENGNLQYYENGVQIDDHNWNDGVITADPTCHDNGVKTYTCGDCGAVKTEAVAKLAHLDENEDFTCDVCQTAIEHKHVWVSSVITVHATCTKDGAKLHTCKCGETETEVIKAPGHVDENGNGSCDICGTTVAVKNGVVLDSDGNVRYYVNGVATRAGLVKDSQGNYYYINSSLKAVKNCYYAFNEAMSNGLLPAGEYQFAADGKMINPPVSEAPHVHAWGDGAVTAPATCTESGLRTYICDCGLSKTEVIAAIGHTDADGNFVCDSCGTAIEHEHVWGSGVITTPATCTKDGVKTYTCGCGETETEVIKAPGHVDENGNGSCDICGTTVAVKNGVVLDSDGNVRYYVNGVATRAGLVKDSQGNYYYINSSLKAVKNCYYAFNEAMSNGLLPAGEYQFAADGKMINPPVSEAPHVHAWGDGAVTAPATCTESGLRTYICDCGLSKTEVIAAIGHTDADGNFVCDSCGTAVEHEHVWDDGVITTPATCTKDGVKTYTCGCGETKTEAVAAIGSHIDENGDLTCDRCSEKLSAKTGLVFDSDGNIRYYENGVAINSKGLVQDSQGNYYYINSSRKAVKNCTYAFSAAKSNGLLPAGEYQFGADGKMILN